MSRTKRSLAYRYYKAVIVHPRIERHRVKQYLSVTDDFDENTYSPKPQHWDYERCRVTNEGRYSSRKFYCHRDFDAILKLSEMELLDDLGKDIKMTLGLLKSIDNSVVFYVDYPTRNRGYVIYVYTKNIKCTVAQYHSSDEYFVYAENSEYWNKTWDRAIALPVPVTSKQRQFLISVLLDFKDKQQDYVCREYFKKEII